MALADRHHGVSTQVFTDGVRAINDIATNVIGIVCTGDDADAKAFPLNQPKFFTSAYDALNKAGDKGTLAKSLDGICDQADARVVIVRVPESETEEEQKANIIGTANGGQYTGLQAMRLASQLCGVKPKIMGVPDFADQAITSELVVISEALNAFAYAGTEGDDITEVAEFKQNFGAKNLMLVDNDFMTFDPITKENVKGATIARILGLRAKLDDQVGWHKSISNVDINGVIGLDKSRTWELTNKNTDVNFLNNNDVSSLIRSDGFQVWGNRTCSADPMYAFEVYVRTEQIIKEMIAESFKWANDLPMHPTLLRDIAMGINAKLAELVLDGKLLGSHVWVDRNQNGKEEVGAGKFSWDYEFTPVPPLEHIGLRQHMTDKYIVNLVDRTVQFASDLKPTTV